MFEKMVILLNTLNLVETKGESTKIMAQCLQHLEKMIQEYKAESGDSDG